MNAILHQYRAWLAPLLTLLLTLLVLAAILIPLNTKRENYLEIIQKSQPRIERIQGLLDHAALLEQKLDQARALAHAQLYPADIDENRLNTELQSRLRNLAQKDGLVVGSLRTLPSRKEPNLNVLLLNLALIGGVTEMQKFLNNLQQPTDNMPALRIDSLTLRNANLMPNTPQVLSIDITVAALRADLNQTTTP